MMMQQQATQGLFLSPGDEKTTSLHTVPINIHWKRKNPIMKNYMTTVGLTYPGTLPENSKKPKVWKFENIKSRKK